MAGSPNPGFQGSFNIGGGIVFRAASVALNEVEDDNEATGIGTWYRESLGGVKVLQGRAAGYVLLNGTNTQTGMANTTTYSGVPFTVTATGTPSVPGTIAWTGLCIINTRGFNKDVNGNDTFALSFRSTGAYVAPNS